MTADIIDLRFPGSEQYDASYYGVQGKKANYVSYSPRSVPHWVTPLARWIAQQNMPPAFDVGCAYGHLVRALNTLGCHAYGVEWSYYAWSQRLDPAVERADARSLPFHPHSFGTIISLDLLEHFVPDDTCKVMDEMCRVAKPKALFVQLIGAHNADDDISRHMEDPTHQNHWPLETYIEEFRKRGVVVDAQLTNELKQNSAWTHTDWRDRILALRRG